MTLAAFLVATTLQVEEMRIIRNRCAAGFAHFTGQITEAQQQKWWQANSASLRAWLYYDQAGALVGFGMLARRPAGGWWATTGVLPEHQGHNYGKQIMSSLVAAADGPVYSAARKDNIAAIKLHPEDAWEVMDEDARRVYFRARGRARGGVIPAGAWYLVGEYGRELITPGESGMVRP